MIKSKAKYSIIILITVQAYAMNSQQIYFGLGLETANFKDYVNSSGVNTLVDINKNSLNSMFEVGYRQNIFNENLSWNFGFSYNNYTINTGFNSGGTTIPLTYELTYFSIKPGIYYSIINDDRFKVQLHTHISHDWLLKGTSSFSNITNNLYTDGTFDKTLITHHRGINIEYALTESMSTYISYNNAGSFKEENQDSVNGEKYSLSTNAISLGILFNINNRSKTVCLGGLF